MTVTTRMAAPNYKIYEPDTLDAIYAKASLDPIMGGIAWGMGNAHKLSKSTGQLDFEEQQARYNKAAADLDALEINSKTEQEAMKIGGTLIGKGEDPTLVRGGSRIYSDPAISKLPELERGVLSSKIAAANAAASADRSKDSASTSYKYMEPPSAEFPQGREVTRTEKGKPNSPNVATPPTSAGSTDAALKQRAISVVGPDATPITKHPTTGQPLPNGVTVWHSPSTGKAAAFDANGRQLVGK